MGKFFNAAVLLLFPLAFAVAAAARSLRNSSSGLISDGVDDHDQAYSYIALPLKEDESSSEACEQMYGFLPCSYSAAGHLFLIVVYEYLLFHGEFYVACGAERIFKILGPGVFGASAFDVLAFLPESLILLASGLLNSKEVAQEFVFTGIGLYAGSTILLLTVIWGTCLILGSRDSPNYRNLTSSSSSSHRQNKFERLLSKWNGYGLITDMETCYTAKIMVLSVVPFIFIEILSLHQLSAAYQQIIILICLLVSVAFMAAYFFYQIFQPWIQERRLEYVKHEHLVIDVLKHLHNSTAGKLLTSEGAPNVAAIRRLFKEKDQDEDNFISISELKAFIQEIKFRESSLDKDKAATEIMKDFDLDNNKKITIDEFVNGVMNWLDETKSPKNKRYHSVKSLKNLYEILQPWITKKREEHEMKTHLISEILCHVQGTVAGSLLKEDGKADASAIKRLFQSIDHDNDNHISQSELKELIMNIKFGGLPWDENSAAAHIMEEFDLDKDQRINEQEFVTGVSNWLCPPDNQTPRTKETQNEIHKKTWKQVDRLIEDKFIDKSPLAWIKAILILLVGIVILGLLAEPLIHSVQNLSKSARLPSFFISFILVPLATNARIAISAIKEASRKTPRTTSLTFSEIYQGVFMNNILGFTVLLLLVYVRGLTWNFSAEVFAVLVVTAAMGSLAGLSSVFPVWISVLAFMLYPLSLVLVYFLSNQSTVS